MLLVVVVKFLPVIHVSVTPCKTIFVAWLMVFFHFSVREYSHSKEGNLVVVKIPIGIGSLFPLSVVDLPSAGCGDSRTRRSKSPTC